VVFAPEISIEAAKLGVARDQAIEGEAAGDLSLQLAGEAL
jgi:hypothetical protein